MTTVKIKFRNKEPIECTTGIIEESDEIFGKLKSPYFTSDESSRDDVRDLNWKIEGIEDPFYENLDQLYPGKGLWGYREENIEQFKKIPNKEVSVASKRYIIVEKIPKKTKDIIAIPLTVPFFYFYPKMSEYINPIFYGVGIWVYVSSLLRIPEFCRDRYDRHIFLLVIG